MFREGLSLRRKLALSLAMYLVFLGLGLMYSARIFHLPPLTTYGVALEGLLLGPVIVWALYKKRTDPAFAARAAARTAELKSPERKPAAQDAYWAVPLFHIMFLALVLEGSNRLLDLVGDALTRPQRVIVATMAATALAGLTVMLIMDVRQRQRKARQADASVPAS